MADRTAQPWAVPGSRLLPNRRAAPLQSGSPPGVGRLLRVACLQTFLGSFLTLQAPQILAARLHDKDDFGRLFRIESASIPISVHFTGDEARPGNEKLELVSRQKPQRAARSERHIRKLEMLLK